MLLNLAPQRARKLRNVRQGPGMFGFVIGFEIDVSRIEISSMKSRMRFGSFFSSDRSIRTFMPSSRGLPSLFEAPRTSSMNWKTSRKAERWPRAADGRAPGMGRSAQEIVTSGDNSDLMS